MSFQPLLLETFLGPISRKMQHTSHTNIITTGGMYVWIIISTDVF